MINKINNINFKGIYTPKFTKFSDSQQRVFDDIKNKLKDKKTNFLVESAENDSVNLSEITGVTETGVGLDKKFSYKRAIKIGRYDENCLFDIKDYKEYIKEQVKDLLGLLAFAGIFIAGMLGFMYISANKKPVAIQQTEKVVNTAKDSLQILKQDSLKMFK